MCGFYQSVLKYDGKEEARKEPESLSLKIKNPGICLKILNQQIAVANGIWLRREKSQKEQES